jgi:hypothetical protein
MTYGGGRRRSLYLDLVDADGNLERPLLVDGWYAPPPSALSVRDGCLEMDRAAFFKSPRLVKPEAAMLERFARLSESGDAEQAVLNYARRSGLLDLCVHHMPYDHPPVGLPVSFATNGGVILTFDPVAGCRSLAGKEPVAAWLYWSRQAAALLAVFSLLRRGDPARPEDWLVLAEDPPWVAGEPRAADLRDEAKSWVGRLARGEVPLRWQQDVASGAIETWLRLAGVGVQLRWTHGVPEIGTRGGGLLGSLGLQILLAAVDSSGLLMCPGCGHLHAPAKAPFRSHKFCEECRKELVPEKLASKRLRIKKSASPAFREAERERARENRRKKRVVATDPPAE